ncbi:TIGR03943 family putative permease subunit [Streptomyces olivochromogenes]|uniref:TIGR03943 family putative permease subunit n=1 Tax=Streptomyces olivochromogenes TaxID=1963 RepID=UPI001F1AC550|nr:TIGR03943 family protein [Streptomyces olivochromogenes]MCF3130706.1 TIGR03943 family protein [Streptomyces olivochromogenes]
MKRHAQVLLLVLTGVGLLHIALFTDLYLRYVKEGLRPLLIASGVLLTLLGLAAAVLDRRADAHARHTHGHDHATAPRVAWLLFLPALSLLVYAPPALGAYTAAHSGTKAVRQQKRFDPLPATSPVPLTLTDFTTRVQQDRTLSVRNRTVQLTGFASPAGQGGGWYLTRIIFTCCAADSQTVKVRVYGTEVPAPNTWLRVTGTWHARGTLGTRSAEAALDARALRPMAQPVNAFTDDLPLTPS